MLWYFRSYFLSQENASNHFDELIWRYSHRIHAPEPGDMDPAKVFAELQQWQQLAEKLGQRVEELERELKYKASLKEADNQTKRDIATLNANVEKFNTIVEAMVEQSKLESKEAIASVDQAIKREETQVDKEIARMKKPTGE